MCGKLLSALRALLYNLLYTSIANLRWGAEMHLFSFPFVTSRHSFASIFLLICVNRSSPHFAMFALDQTPFVLALVASLAFDHSDHEMISPIRVIALGACVVFMR